MNRLQFAQIVVVAALTGGVPQWALAQSSSANYKIPQSTLNNGVGNMASGSYKLSSSLGDPFFTGPSTSNNYKITHGFWPAGTGTAPALQNTVSRKVHGSAGTFNLPLTP